MGEGSVSPALSAVRELSRQAVSIVWTDSEAFVKTLERHFPRNANNDANQYQSRNRRRSTTSDEKNPQIATPQVRSLTQTERESYLVKCKAIRERLQTSKASIPRQERVELIRNYQRMKQMIRDSCAIKIQAVWRGYQVRRPVASARDPCHSRLCIAQETIRKQRESYSRPQDINKMTIEQLQEDKAFLKRLLNGIDKAFKHKNGRLPTKQEKETYRPIYEEYRAIKDKINADSLQKSPDISIQRIKAEKRALQIQLNKFEKSFRLQHGRKIQYQRDIVPVKAEFERYMYLKSALANYQSQIKKSSPLSHSTTTANHNSNLNNSNPNPNAHRQRSSSPPQKHHKYRNNNSTSTTNPDLATATAAANTATAAPTGTDAADSGPGSLQSDGLASPIRSLRTDPAECSPFASPREDGGDRLHECLKDTVQWEAEAAGKNDDSMRRRSES